METPTYYVQQARPHTPNWRSLPICQYQGPSLGPGSPHVTTGRAGLSTPPPSTPRLLRLCPCLAEPKWDVASGPGAAPSLTTPLPRSPPGGLEWATARRAGQGPNWNLDRPCLSLSSHGYKLSSWATGTCKETVPDRWVPRGATVLTVTKTPTPGCSRSLSLVQLACPHQVGTSQYAGASVLTRVFAGPSALPTRTSPRPQLRHLDLTMGTPQARHCRPRTLSSAEGVVIQLEIRRERSFTSPWWQSLEKWAGGGAQGRGRNPGGDGGLLAPTPSAQTTIFLRMVHFSS